MGIVEYIRGDHLVQKYSSVINGTLVLREDELVESYWFAKGPFIFSVVAIYLSIALMGPKWMANRKPFDLRKTMIFYNAIQVFFCSFYLYVTFFSMPTTEILSFLYDNVCRPFGKPYHQLYRLYALHGTALYLLMKIADLPDTMFMVLRKQFTHITFLHLFHHTTMVVSMWFHLIYVRGELGGVFGLINIFVHVVMYSYYLMSAIGPTCRALVTPWKKYVTMLQISQFGIILSMLGVLSWNGCEMPPNLKIMWLANNILFFVLFINFYIRTFLVDKGKKE